jgi:signal transduction histidine kinase
LREIIHDAANCLAEARRSVSELRRNRNASPGLAEELSESARQLTVSSGARLKLAVDTLAQELPAYVEYNLLRIAQEAIINAVKHAGACTIEVTLLMLPGALRITVRDDGAGFVPGDAAADHFGLVGMKERAKEIGAELRVTSELQMGATIAVDFPVKKMDPQTADAARRGARHTIKAEL